MAAMSPPASREELISRAQALVPVLRERAARAEELRMLPPETVQDFLDTGIIRVGNPDRYGGLGIEYDAMFEVAWELGRACGASAWCYSLWVVHAFLVGHWPQAAQEEVFGGPAGADTLLSSSFNPSGATAEPVAGGYRLSGHWQFSSGIDYSHWIMAGARFPEGVRWVLLPKQDYRIEDTWFTSGLCGSGSKDVIAENVFVPAHRVMNNLTAGDSDLTGWELHRQPRYRMPLSALMGWDIVGPLLGMTQGVIDTFVAKQQGRRLREMNAAEAPNLQIRLAESSAELDACKALFRADVLEALDMASRGVRFSELDRLRFQRDRAYVTQTCTRAVNRLFEASGGHAIFTSEPMQRLHRDANAVCQREQLLLDYSGMAYGKAVLTAS